MINSVDLTRRTDSWELVGYLEEQEGSEEDIEERHEEQEGQTRHQRS